ncbi:MAG: hypothetical protein D6791_11280 [Chloroflexi bacterium]|nr:MAG: hypothetical protein D6791_11280 [Chloroflexota bacterium]
MRNRIPLLLTAGMALVLVMLAACAVPPPPVQPPPPEDTALRAQVEELQARLAEIEAEKQALQEQNALLKELAGPPPASIAQYFPPEAPGPIWLFEMFTLAGAFDGMIADMQQQDMEGLQANFEAFKAQYTKLAGMMPEWSHRFPMEPLDNLEAAIASGNPAQIGPAFGQVGGVCGSCHLVNQVKVMQQYHFKDFGTVEGVNPLSGESIGWLDYMFGMSGTFGAIGADLQQGQLDAARQDFQAFQALFSNLPELCKACHDTERTYFVDASVQGLVAQLGEALQADAPDPQQVGELIGAIGSESCLRCHLVHKPAAMAKARWETFADLFGN